MPQHTNQALQSGAQRESYEHDLKNIILLYRIADAVRATGVSRSKIYQLIGAGELRTIHLGRAVRITADSLHALIACRVDASPRRRKGAPKSQDERGQP